jgi:hypothetical protein
MTTATVSQDYRTARMRVWLIQLASTVQSRKVAAWGPWTAEERDDLREIADGVLRVLREHFGDLWTQEDTDEFLLRAGVK